VSEAAGINIDYSRRVRICSVCKIQLLEGDVNMEVEDALTPEDEARKIILAYQAKSISNVVVEA
jgi:ferredoxin